MPDRPDDHRPSACALCARDPDDAAMRAYWAQSGRDEGVRSIARETGMRAAEVREHYRSHRAPQPPPAGPLRREQEYARAERLPARQRAVLDMVWRVRVATTDQIARLYFAGSDDARPGAQVRARVGSQLTDLARAGMLHRFYSRRELPSFDSRAPIWMLGRNALPYLEGKYGPIGPEHYVSSARKVGSLALEHDLSALEVLVSLRERARTEGYRRPGDAREVRLDLPPGNWYGPRHLTIGYNDPLTGQERHLISDGFAAVSARGPGREGGWPLGWVCPFFLEYDRGTRERWDVVEQLLSYHSMHLSGAAGRRFPQLDVPGYAPVVLMVFLTPGRLRSILRHFRLRAGERGLRRGAPILLSTATELAREGWRAGCAYVWDTDHERRLPLYGAIERLSEPLIHSRRVGPDAPLAIDRAGASLRVVRTGVYGERRARPEPPPGADAK